MFSNATGEPDERCASEGGYCMTKTNCPGGSIVDGKNPGDESIKCCLSVPYQEPECEAEGSICGAECNCQGEPLTGYCPKQPGPIKCCVQDEIVENCNEESVPNECIERKLSRISDCSSEPSETCVSESGYCGDPDKCPGNNVVHNKCPGGQDNKCCLSIPFQEAECEAEGGTCGDKCGCEGDVLHGFCPSQPDSIKCCKVPETTTQSATEDGITTAASIEECVLESTTPANCPGGGKYQL